MSESSSRGSSSSATLFLVHGDFGDGHDAWAPLCAEIAGRYRTVTVDRLGFGELLGSGDRFTIAGESSTLLAIADELELESMHLVGHSYGA
ncbi:MAG: alpha/beta fold hydrolase, partial [Chloroflexia bacterium]|nr:alpha/beta fold hydrolase [Chloroflexia bacterium]